MLNSEQKRQLIQIFRDEIGAQIFDADVIAPFTFQAITLDLGTAVSADNPYKVSFPFKAFILKNATGGVGSVFARFNNSDSGVSWVPFDNNDGLKTTRMFSGMELYWKAQAGKTMVLIVSTEAELISGSLINSGTIAIAPSSTLTQNNPVVAATTATIISAASTTKKFVTIYNGDTATVFIGPSTITNSGATRGYPLLSGSTLQINTTAAVYAYSVAGFAAGVVTVIDEV